MTQPIWLLSTRGRPREAQACIDACTTAGMTSRGVVYVDEDTGLYNKLKVPGNWEIHREKQWLSLQGSMSWCFDSYPNASAYGWLADDTRPRTQGWDKQLEHAAGDWHLAYAKDLWMSEQPIFLKRLRSGEDLSSGLCWGGKLVRTVGWWALPGVRQAGIDTAWYELIRPFGLHHYTESVVVEHLNWRTGKRKKDKVDDWARDGVDYVTADIEARDKWVYSQAFVDTVTMLATALGLDLDSPPLVYALTKNRIDLKLQAGTIKANDVVVLQALERAANDYHRLHPDPEPA